MSHACTILWCGQQDKKDSTEQTLGTGGTGGDSGREGPHSRRVWWDDGSTAHAERGTMLELQVHGGQSSPRGVMLVSKLLLQHNHTWDVASQRPFQSLALLNACRDGESGERVMREGLTGGSLQTRSPGCCIFRLRGTASAAPLAYL